jgi:leucyl aminopeptidase
LLELSVLLNFEYFTQEHAAWAHLDIAGVAFGDDEFAKVNMQLHMAFI